jgi:hypothetical protein
LKNLGMVDPHLLHISNVCSLPVQVLDDVVDDAYPPQQKSFAMLKWMADHVGTR